MFVSDQMSTGFPMNHSWPQATVLLAAGGVKDASEPQKKFQRGWRIDSSRIISISMNGKAERETTLCFPFPNLESKGQMFAVMWVEKLV